MATRCHPLCWCPTFLLALTLATTAHAQDASTCTASILNRTTRVNPDGTFVIDNIPSNQGFGRIRIICPDADSTRGGASNFIQIIPGGEVSVGGVPLGVIPPSVKSLAVTVSPATLTGPGATAQLAVVATFSDGSTRPVTNGTAGTTYTSSNPAIGAVNANGLITAANQSGTLIVSMVNDGVFASKMITVNLTNDRDGDGMPDDFEEANGCLDPTVPDGDVDPDGDSLTNLAEFNAGTDPCAADTDGDGLNDGQEIALGSNPTLEDSDSDGLEDGAETNPSGDDDGDGLKNILDPDRENDGLPDGIEVRICNTPTCASPTADSDGDGLSNIDEVRDVKTDPSKPDTDNDGINDGEEIIAGTDGFVTDPLKTDTDGDGFQDGLEIVLASDPLNSTSLPNLSPPGNLTGPTFSILNGVNPGLATPVLEAIGQTFSVLNGENPGQPTPVTEAVSQTFSVVNTTDPGQSSPVTEAVGQTFSVVNGSNPGQPTPVTEAVGQTFSVINGSNPGQATPVTEAVGQTFSVQNQP